MSQQPWGPPPQQQYQQQPQQQAWGGQQQQAPAGPPAPDVAGFWGTVSTGGSGAPSYKWGSIPNVAPQPTDIGEFVQGEIISQRVQQQTQGLDDDREPKFDKNGNPLWQLVVVMKTPLRGWQKVTTSRQTGQPNVPKDDNGQPLGPEHDEGLRTINIKNLMSEAVQRAMRDAGVTQLDDGGKLGIRLKGFRGTGKGNPMPEYDAFYEPPAPKTASADWAAAAPAPQQSPALPPLQQQFQQPTPAPAAPAPDTAYAQQAFQQQAQASQPAPQQQPVAENPWAATPAGPPPPAAGNPWAGQQQADQPPF